MDRIDLVDGLADAVGMHEQLAGDETTGSICVYELSKVADFVPSTLLAGKEVLGLSMEDAAAAGAVFRELANEGTPIGETATRHDTIRRVQRRHLLPSLPPRWRRRRDNHDRGRTGR